MKNPNRNYFGHESQLYRVEEHRLIGGKGDNMRLFEVNNGSGLEFTICADRSADISRLSYQGINLSYFSVCGYTAPTYYDKTGLNFLKSCNWRDHLVPLINFRLCCFISCNYFSGRNIYQSAFA